jgi:hypothetical protein
MDIIGGFLSFFQRRDRMGVSGRGGLHLENKEIGITFLNKAPFMQNRMGKFRRI